MKIRFVEEYDPIRDFRCWWTERTVLGMWLGPFGYVSDSLSSDKGRALEAWDRIRTNRMPQKKYKVLMTEQL